MRMLMFVCAAFAAGVAGAAVELPEPLSTPVYPTVRVYRDFAYGPRKDKPDEGPGCKSRWTTRNRFLKGVLANSHRTGQSFDVYLPRPKEQLKGDEPVFVYVHGGGWHDVWDKDSAQELFCFLASRTGYVVVSMNYILLPEDLRQAKVGEVTFVDMLRDIDLLDSHLATFLPEAFGVKAKKIAIGGESAGGHLSSLYAYDGANPELLGLGLAHRLPIGFELNIVGATDLTAPRIADAMRVFGDVPLLKRFSPVNMITSKTPPTLLCYSSSRPGAPDDGCIPVATFTLSTNRLAKAGVDWAAHFEPAAMHAEVLGPKFPAAREFYVRMFKEWAPRLLD